MLIQRPFIVTFQNSRENFRKPVTLPIKGERFIRFKERPGCETVGLADGRATLISEKFVGIVSEMMQSALSFVQNRKSLWIKL